MDYQVYVMFLNQHSWLHACWAGLSAPLKADEASRSRALHRKPIQRHRLRRENSNRMMILLTRTMGPVRPSSTTANQCNTLRWMGGHGWTGDIDTDSAGAPVRGQGTGLRWGGGGGCLPLDNISI